MSNNNIIDEGRNLLRELQTMLFEETIDNKSLFSKTVQIDQKLNSASIDYNKYLNDIEKKNK